MTVATEDRLAIAELIHRSFRLIDDGRASQSAALFAHDAKLTFGPGAPKPGTIEGPAIAAAMTAREGQKDVVSRHVISNLILEPAGDGRVGARWIMTLFRTAGEPVPDVASLADVEDVLVKLGGGWKIAERTITPVFNR